MTTKDSTEYDTVETHGPLSPVDIAEIEGKLKPCPFCGGRGHLGNTWTASYWVQCGNENCEAEVGGLAAEESTSKAFADHLCSARSAAKRWNRRAA